MTKLTNPSAKQLKEIEAAEAAAKKPAPKTTKKASK